jgi:hypothetical protein
MGEHRLNASESVEENLMHILFAQEEQRGEICANARFVWNMLYPAIRVRATPRIDKGVKRRVQHVDDGASVVLAAQFLRRRRTASQNMDHKVQVADEVVTSEGCGEAWTQKHELERNFQRAKRDTRKVEAFLSKSLADSDLSDDLIKKASTFQATVTRNMLAREREETAKANKIAPRVRISDADLHGLNAYAPDYLRTPALDAAASRLNVEFVADPANANFYVANAVEDLDALSAWAARLRGSWVISPASLCCGKGAAIKYHGAFDTKRWLWMSPLFQRSFAPLSTLIATDILDNGTKWHLLITIDEFAGKKQVAERNRNTASVIALVEHTEVFHYAGVKYVFEPGQFQEFITKIDREHSVMGPCGV